jgi:hypothetical protein
LEILQWTGLLLGALTWTAQHVVGYGVTVAKCGEDGERAHFGINNTVWQGSMMGVAVALVLTAELAALAVLFATRKASYESPPATGRIRFFAIAAAAANVIFLMIILLDGSASILNVTCRQG